MSSRAPVGSVHSYAGSADDFGPFSALGGNERAEFSWRPELLIAPSVSIALCISCDRIASFAAELIVSTMSLGVPAGATSPDQKPPSRCGKPASRVVGTSGNFGSGSGQLQAQCGRVRTMRISKYSRSRVHTEGDSSSSDAHIDVRGEQHFSVPHNTTHSGVGMWGSHFSSSTMLCGCGT